MIIPQTTENRKAAQETVARGGVIAFRTDTFYGLGADPFNVSAVRRIKELKGREGDKPILVVISDVDQIDRVIAAQSKTFKTLIEKLWPGPLTIIGAAAAGLSEELTAGTKTLGVRLPNDDEVRALARTCGGALTATSANLSGQPPARTAQEVQDYFERKIDLIVDGGPAKTDQPSTVVEAVTDGVSLVREGVLPWTEILAACG